MKKFLFVTSLFHMTAITLCAPSNKETRETHRASNTTYDQRQVGKYNIHFNIKDVSIIALSSEDIIDHIGDSDSYADYYEYEDSEYTVNPITADLSGRPTTKKPNETHQSLMPSIAGLNLSSVSTTEPSSAAAVSAPQTLVVIHEKPAASQETDKNAEKASVSYQPDEIPVQVIVEPLLKPKLRKSPQPAMKRKLNNRQVSKANADADDEFAVRPRRRRGQLIERIRSRRAQNGQTRSGNANGCGKGQTGNDCRVRRSGMSGFFEMLRRFLPQQDN